MICADIILTLQQFPVNVRLRPRWHASFQVAPISTVRVNVTIPGSENKRGNLIH